MRNLILVILVVTISITGCESPKQEKLKIVANTWIGYSPLFYAKEKGWLDEINIKLFHVVSLGESKKLFETGNADIFTGTQYEYEQVKKQFPNLVPIHYLDRSNGGDMVMSNLPFEEIKKTDKKIKAYLEIDSVNQILLRDFANSHAISTDNIEYVNKDQSSISSLRNEGMQNPIIIITYTPYNKALEKQGFFEITNTKSSNNLNVIDAMYTKKKTFNENNEKIKSLTDLVNKAVKELEKKPEEFFRLVNPYLEYSDYNEFLEALSLIEWINSPTEYEKYSIIFR